RKQNSPLKPMRLSADAYDIVVTWKCDSLYFWVVFSLILSGFKFCYTLFKDESKLIPKSMQKPARKWSGRYIEAFVSLYRFEFNLSLFDKFYGKKALTLKRLYASLISSVCGISLGIVVFQIFFPVANQALLLLIEHYDVYVGLGALYLFILTLLIDFICIEKTRLIIACARSSSGFKRYGIILFDLLISPMVFVCIFFVGISILSMLYFFEEGTQFPLNVDGARGIVTIKNWWQLTLFTFYNGGCQSFFPPIKFLFGTLHGKMSATFIRIPAPISDAQFPSYIIRGQKFFMVGFLYPYIHSILSSFTLVIWSFGMALGSFTAIIVRSIAIVFGRFLNTQIGAGLFEERRIFLVAFSAMNLFLAIVIFIGAMIFTYQLFYYRAK
ncbi:hypothetical protein, partial [Acidocella aminolytica]